MSADRGGGRASQAERGKDPSPKPPRRRRQIAGRHLRFTREGKYFVALTFGIGFAAINTGNNLLYLVLGMLLALIVGSGVLSGSRCAACRPAATRPSASSPRRPS